MFGLIFKSRAFLSIALVLVLFSIKTASLEAVLININTASLAELDTLPGIGPTYAQRIVDYRIINGPFSQIEDVQNVSGIGPATFVNIKDLITVGSPTTVHSDIGGAPATQASPANQSSTATTANYSQSTVTSYQPPTKLEVGIGRDRLGTVGSPLEFKVESSIKHGRQAVFVWNMGDGTQTGGEVVSHTYEYPGEYVVVLKVSSPEGEALSRVNVKIVEPKLEIVYADQAKISIKNNSDNEVNLFGRVLAWRDRYFAFPQETILKAEQNINFSQRVTGLSPLGPDEVSIVVVGGHPNRLLVDRVIASEREKKIVEIKRQIAQLEGRKLVISNLDQERQLSVLREDLGGEQVATSSVALLNSALGPEVAPKKPESGFLGRLKRFFLMRND